jgi:type I restriction enzyme M protein
MILHGIDVPSNIRHDNTLARPLRDYGPKDRVDVIVTNPPFGGMEEDGIENNFPATFRTRETADLFLALIMHLLKDGGRAARGAARWHPVWRRHQDPHQGTTAGRVQPAHHRAPAQRRVQPLHRHQDQPAVLHQGRADEDVWFYEHPYPPGVKNYNKTKPMRIEEFDAGKMVGQGKRQLQEARGE